ncbi:MAG: hypothetical protein R3F42_16300 [Pseudomonadota bacterium]
MNRRQFLTYSALQGFIAACPSVSLSATQIVIAPTGGDDTEAINAALRASAHSGYPAALQHGAYTVTDTIHVPSGARLIGLGNASRVSFRGGRTGVVIRIDEPHRDNAVRGLLVEDQRSAVPFIAMIGN